MGIKNGGATCYMNSLFQQLFMQPSIRAFVLAGAEVPQAERRDSVFYQLQVGLCWPPPRHGYRFDAHEHAWRDPFATCHTCRKPDLC